MLEARNHTLNLYDYLKDDLINNLYQFLSFVHKQDGPPPNQL